MGLKTPRGPGATGREFLTHPFQIDFPRSVQVNPGSWKTTGKLPLCEEFLSPVSLTGIELGDDEDRRLRGEGRTLWLTVSDRSDLRDADDFCAPGNCVFFLSSPSPHLFPERIVILFKTGKGKGMKKKKKKKNT
ncbi:hypothetical protein CEXT_38661 [Caerostris extrusa]|uniref:Uncharacterized protein n=1 Tax=Caerostris extrusa TaxID=172846 RepID=A0AAV4PU43_CAEEX|nr:hypothetical protein CEXT_38661 [Caerostris extrusa]